MVARGGGKYRVGAMGKGGQNVQTSNYKIYKSWGFNVWHGDCNNTVILLIILYYIFENYYDIDL